MPESKFHRRRNLQNPEIDHLQQPRKKTEVLLSMGYDNESVQNLNKSNSNSNWQTVVKASVFKKDLGHDLYQLTKGNMHEVNLSPYPSLTVMVQPNKIDYTKRCKNVIVLRRL